MTAFAIVWGAVLLLGGVVLAVWGFRAMRTRPGWGGRYGKGAFVTLIGGMVALAGVTGLLTS